jgi:hypothetical protein
VSGNPDRSSKLLLAGWYLRWELCGLNDRERRTSKSYDPLESSDIQNNDFKEFDELVVL